MKSYLDCIPCFVRQTLDAVRMVTPDEAIQERVLREVIRETSIMDFDHPPPHMGRRIHALIRLATGNADPYREVKEHSNRMALSLYPELRRQVQDSENPFEAAVRFAIAGNIIDFGVRSVLDDAVVRESIDDALSAPIDSGAVAVLQDAIGDADDILYLADNAGEIVLDRLLIELLPVERIALVVKGAPVINDATLADAKAAGLAGLVEIIDNGSDAPGTIVDICSQSFRERFLRADLVIAKGQGNYETLSGVDKHTVFLLKAKCPVIARDIGCEVGGLVVLEHNRAEPMASNQPSRTQ